MRTAGSDDRNCGFRLNIVSDNEQLCYICSISGMPDKNYQFRFFSVQNRALAKSLSFCAGTVVAILVWQDVNSNH